MGFRVNRRISLGKNVRVNIGKRGVSTSVKMGPVTVNSRGRKTVHVAKGVSYTINPKTKRNTAPRRRSTVGSKQQASYTPSSAGSTPHQPRPKTLKQLEFQYKAYNVLLWVMYALTAFTILMCLFGPDMLVFAIPCTLMSIGFTKLKATLRKQLEERRSDDASPVAADADGITTDESSSKNTANERNI
jgi:hypothetical protein